MRTICFWSPFVCCLFAVGVFGGLLGAQDPAKGSKATESEEIWTGEVRAALTDAVRRLRSVDSTQGWADEVQNTLFEAEKRLRSTSSGLVRAEEIKGVFADAARRLKSTTAIGAAREAEVRNILSDAGTQLTTPNVAPVNTTPVGSESTGDDAVTSLQASPPTITPIKGGYFVRFDKLTEVGAIQLDGPMTGKFEILFDNRLEDIGVETKPIDNPEFLLVLADYWIVRGKPERAVPLYELGLEKDSNNFVFQNNLALLYSTAMKDHDKALNIVDGALKERADNVTLLDTKGLILINAGRSDEAIPVLQRAVELSCQKPICVMHYAYALDMQGQQAAAREWFNKALPLLEAASPTFLKDSKNMFDYLKMNYASPQTIE